jgi:quinol monooxygenase YgiN
LFSLYHHCKEILIMPQQIEIIAHFQVVENLVTQFIERFHARVVVPSRAEVGCIAYNLVQDVNDSTRFSTMETWQCQEAEAAHRLSPHAQECLEWLPPYLVGLPTMGTYCTAEPSAEGRNIYLMPALSTAL